MAELTTMEALRRSPLDGMQDAIRRGSHPGSVRLAEWPFVTMIGVRAERESAAGRSVESALGVAFPDAVGRTTRQRAHHVLWLGPDEWLILSQDEADSLVARLQDAAAASGGNAQIVDLSANRTVLELGGPHARDVLEKGCPADLHPRSFADGTAVTTTLARVPVIVWKVDETLFRVLPRASFAQYVTLWLLDAMREFAPQDIATAGAS